MSHSDPRFSFLREINFADRAAAPQLFAGESSNNTNINQKFLVSGQGVFIFSLRNEIKDSFSTELFFRNESGNEGLKLVLGLNKIKLFRSTGMFDALLQEEKHTGLINGQRAFFWISLDSQNLNFSFGIGEARLETQSFKYSFAKEEKHSFLEKISDYSFDSNVIEAKRLLRDPIIENVPLYVKGMDEITMDDIAGNTVMAKGNLSPIGQKLYENIAGKNFILDSPDFPDFSKAIEHSIANPQGWCYKILEAKSAKQPEGKKKRIYLRITLGKNGGESPGMPYVMEIWPPACYSSRHSHAGANALIRVLSGEIAVDLYPYLGSSEAFGTAKFSAGDITWISPVLNQFHMLKNPNAHGPTCITIQCYMYDADDSGHYDYFDYIDDQDKVQQFDPNSDMDFADFKKKMKEEWNAR